MGLSLITCTSAARCAGSRFLTPGNTLQAAADGRPVVLGPIQASMYPLPPQVCSCMAAALSGLCVCVCVCV